MPHSRRVDLAALLIAENDQSHSEVAALAQLLGFFRERLIDSGFSTREAFALSERLNEVALWDNAQAAALGEEDDAAE